MTKTKAVQPFEKSRSRENTGVQSNAVMHQYKAVQSFSRAKPFVHPCSGALEQYKPFVQSSVQASTKQYKATPVARRSAGSHSSCNAGAPGKLCRPRATPGSRPAAMSGAKACCSCAQLHPNPPLSHVSATSTGASRSNGRRRKTDSY